MCTLTILRGNQHCVVTMNRDERIVRSESGRFIEDTHNSIPMVYPVDEQTLGTWMAVNSHAIIGGVLNRYQSQHEDGKNSRGELIPYALQSKSVEEACRNILALDLNLYNPFDLFLIDAQQSFHLQWDGDVGQGDLGFEEIELDTFMFSSSSLLRDEVLSYRKEKFKQWWKNSQSVSGQTYAQSVLNGFHSKQDKRYKTHSVLMEREHSHTKSISQVELGLNAITFKYYPGVLNYGLHEPLVKTMTAT